MDSPSRHGFFVGEDESNALSRIDFDREALGNIIESADFDQMINQEEVFDLDDSDIDKLINPENASLGSNNSLDQLVKMPIVEFNDDAVDDLLQTIAREENIPIPLNPASPRTMTSRDEYIVQDEYQDPLLGTLSKRLVASGGGDATWTAPGSFPRKDSFHMRNISQEVDALDRMVSRAVSSREDQVHREQPQSHDRHLDLEREKLKLLTQLNEINQRQHSLSMPSNTASGTQYVASRVPGADYLHPNVPTSQYVPSQVASVGGMSGISDMLRLQQLQQPVSSAVGGGPAETPLTSFLRKNQKAPPPVASAAASMLSRNVPGAPQAASVFSETNWMNQNPYLEDGGAPNQHLLGAMDRTSVSQNMVRKMSARTLLARADSGSHMRSGVMQRVSGTGNATWGNAPSISTSFQSSSILPKHMSENNLAKSGVRSGLMKTPSKNSLSRENLRGFMRAHSRPSEDSIGGVNIVPIKRCPSASTKYKVGNSRSVPHLLMQESGSRGDFSQHMLPQDYQTPQQNAAW